MDLFRSLLIITLILFSFKVTAKTRIHWMTINYPPAYIIYGPEKNTGINDLALKIMIENLGDYTHEIISNVTMPRMLNFFRGEKIYCSPGLAITKDQFPGTVNSRPILIIPPAGIIILKNRKKRFSIKNGCVDLNKLLSDRKLNAGIMKGGQYGLHVDRLIREHKDQDNIYRKTPISQLAFLYMLLRGRIDYLIDYPISYYNNLKDMKKRDREKFLFIQIKNVKNIKMIRALCNKGPGSYGVIKRLNRLILRDIYKKAVVKKLSTYLPNEIRDKYIKINLKLIGAESE